MEPITDDSHKEEVINVTIPDDQNNQHYKDVKHCKCLKLIVIHIQRLIISVGDLIF